jgi:hypothetical protein
MYQLFVELGIAELHAPFEGFPGVYQTSGFRMNRNTKRGKKLLRKLFAAERKAGRQIAISQNKRRTKWKGAVSRRITESKIAGF